MKAPIPKASVYRTPFIVGLPVMPKQFFDRREQVEQFYGQCILGPVLQPTRILGLKRSGKTSFLNYISDLDVRNQFLTKTDCSTTKFAYVNAQTIHSCHEFYTVVADAIQKQIELSSTELPELKTGRAFEKWLDKILQSTENLKIIVLIDEFERLNEVDEFNVEFFGFLRALASGHQSSFTWVTASAVDLYTLDKRQKTSPFWNIFHQMPVIMGGFRDEDAELLIRESLKTIGATITKSEINEILALSGNIPYFVQAVADAWHKLKESHTISLAKRKKVILDVLSNPGNQIQHIYKDYWTEMSENRRALLKNIAGDRRNLSASYADLITLSDYGLIVSDNGRYGGYRISGHLLKQFIIDVDSESGVASPSIQIDARGGTIIEGDVRTEGGTFIGRDQVNSGIDAKQLFAFIYEAIDKKSDLAENDKADLRQDVDELHQELAKNEKLSETFVRRRLRNIGRMAPDILEVTLATISNPVAGFGILAKKVAEKVRSSAA